MSEQTSGTVFNIQHYSVHDGPGIRTLIFLKGCPLRCLWCSNPESQTRLSQLAYNATKCVGCARCVAACPQKALELGEVQGAFSGMAIGISGLFTSLWLALFF